MIRVLFYLAIVTVVALGAIWLADHPGTVLISWGGSEYQLSTLTGLVGVLALAVAILIAWSLIRFVFNIPALLSVASRNKRRNRGLRALSRGLVAVGAGDATAAKRQAAEAGRLLPNEPLALLLRAQAAQMAEDRDGARAVFTAMLEHADTKPLGLRGLYMEASRRGDTEAAYRFAAEAQNIAALPWAGQAVLQHRAAQQDWTGALATVEHNAAGRLIDRPTANRQRAVLRTAIALGAEERTPEEALELAREALRVAPTLVPAAALAGRLLARRGDLRKASKIVETAFAATPHPDLAAAYVNARPGDSSLDRLTRAETLARRAPGHPESRLTVARAALEAREFGKARQVMAPLVNGEQGSRPTVRTCLMMADIEEAEHGAGGALFEWLQRAARAPHDPAWIADGVTSDTWAPVSPVTGRIDAFVWDTPQEQLTASEPRRSAAFDAPSSEDAPAPILPDAPALVAEPVGPASPPVAPAEPVEPAYLPPEPARREPAQPVVFPLKAPPDDPGPFRAGSRSARSGDSVDLL